MTEEVKYQWKTFVPIGTLIRSKKVISELERDLESGEILVVDTKEPAFFKFEAGKGPDYYKYAVYRFC